MNIIKTYIVDYNKFNSDFYYECWTALYETESEGFYITHPNVNKMTRLTLDQVNDLKLLIPF